MTKPEWLSEGEGFADVTLSRPLNMGGTQVSVLRLREPTVNDQRTADAHKGGDAEREIAMMANLCEVTPADIGALSLRDYKRLQVAFTGFID